MARRALLIINRRSRRGENDFSLASARLKAQGFSLIEQQVEEPVRIASLIGEHCEKADLVILGGGDGTMNSAAEALLACGLPLGILPIGTANDLARTLGIPPSLERACDVIAGGRLHRIDLGRVNNKHFFNVASIGISVGVAHRLSPEIKRRWGILGYLYALLQVMRENRSFRANIRYDHQTVHLKSIQISVGNGRYYGGGFAVAENAAIDDHRLDLYSLRPLSFWQLFRLAPAVYEGRHGRNREQVRFLHGTEITIHTRKSMPVDTDGEVTTSTPAHFQVLPGALQVYVPADFR